MRQTVFYSALAVAACLALIAGCETSDRVDGYPAGTNSFAQGTLVRTSDGHVPIETLEVGDLVQSFDPVSGEWSDRAVIAVRAREAREELVSIQLGNSRIDGTAGHVVFLAATGEQTGQLPVALRGDADLIRLEGIAAGDMLQAAAGPVVVREAARKTVQTVLYSLLVEGNHTYAVTEDSLAVGDASIQITARPWHRLPREADLRAGGACFPAGTPVRTPDGLVSLDDLRIGDAVRTAHPLSGSQVTSRITGLSQQEYEGDMVTIRVDDEDVTSTGNHPFWVSSGKDLDRRPDPSDVPAAERGFTSGGRWVEARALRPGDTLGTIGGRNATIERVTTGIVTTSVYNITVDSVHTYAVSAGGYLVHNKGGMQAERAAPPTLSAEPAAEYEEPVPQFNTEEYNRIFEPGFKRVIDEPLSTLSIDVDTASYSNVRRFLAGGELPPRDAVRIEELINYFTYEYPEPAGTDPFTFVSELSDCPWNPDTKLLHVGLQAKRMEYGKLPPNNLVFLLDVSGSMSSESKLPLLQQSLLMLLDELRPIDHVAIVVYAGAAGLVLPPTPSSEKEVIAEAFRNLRAGGSTAGGEGIRLAYDVARQHFNPAGNNRVILGTDGDFNVGPSSQGALQRIIEEEREGGVYLTVLGFGMGNYKDSRMETLADYGNGNYAYIDTLQEAQKVLVREMAGTLYAVANDVKIQIEFNPAVIDEYRIIGYENRLLEAEDFADDRKDAGELGAGHSVTVLYELRLTDGGPAATRPLRYQTSIVAPSAAESGELLFLKFRYKPPGESTSKEIAAPVPYEQVPAESVSPDFTLSASLAAFGMLMRGSEHLGTGSTAAIVSLVERSLSFDPNGYREGLLGLVKLYEWLPRP